MDLNIRKAILANLSTNDHEQLEATIKEAIQSGEEKTLPGLGYLFELIWAESDTEQRKTMVDSLEQGIKEQLTS
ncbi:small acid-soluble spore protein SspI [Ornithinibacillus sp. 4-3]|uniref:Small, acid-soluble spore protein I n=1 Tax=Ornithinibacillus sp. 4-3 TaxID=3231488 RepID=A0AB39HMB7_9BACI